jgi:hypothetical protein
MTQLQLNLDGDTLTFAPGAQLLVTASWKLDTPARQIDLRLLWFTEGKGDSDVHVVQQLEFPQPGLEESKRLAIRLPDAPYSFSGALISLVWALELVTTGSAEAARLEFVMAPHGEEIRLEPVPGEEFRYDESAR